MAQVPDNDSSEETHPRFQTALLYVGDLDETIDEHQLFNLFNDVAKVVSVRICRDSATGKSLGYGYVNHSSRDNADKAIRELNFIPVNGETIWVTYANRDSGVRKSGKANLYVKNLAPSVHHKDLCNHFSSFGNILACRVATDVSGQSKGYGFVQFESEDSAKEAIEKLNGSQLNGKKISVCPFLSKQDMVHVSSDANFTNVYVRNLSNTITDAELQNIFGEYGEITSAVVMRYGDGRSKGFGFVNFANADNAARARDGLDGQTFHGKTWCVRRAQTKAQRERELTELYDRNRGIFSHRQGRNLYIKNLDDNIDDKTLKELFSEFGVITSAKIMRYADGISKGTGFVAYSNREAANLAIESMNGRLVAGKHLYVALAQKKEERRAMLETYFSQNRQTHPTLISQEELDYHLQNLPLLERTTGPPVPIFMPQLFRPQPLMPQPLMPQPLMPQPLMPQPFMPQPFMPQPFMPQPFMPQPFRPQLFMPQPFMPQLFMPQRGPPRPIGHQPPGLGQPLVSHQQMIPRGYFYQGPPRPNVQNSAMVSLASAVASVPPAEQRIVLGDLLFPLVERLVYNAAPKVTGMLLEMDQAEVIHMIHSADALAEKVEAAMVVLRRDEEERYKRIADELASLSFNEPS